jgi:hypothetical protein
VSQREDHRQQTAREQLPKDDSPNRGTDERVGFRNALGEQVIGKESIKNLQQEVEFELGPDAGEHERSHNRHAALLFGVKLRNKNAKWEIAEKTKKKNRQAQTFSSSLFTNSLPSTRPFQAIELAQIFRPAACQLFLHSNDSFSATLHFGFAFRV